VKIAQIAPHFSPEFGGHEFYLCRALAKEGVDVTLFTSIKPSRIYYYETLEKPKKLRPFETLDNFNLVRVPITFELGGRFLRFPFSIDLLEKLCRSRYDVVHSHEFFQFFTHTAIIASKLNRTPIVITQHGYTLGKNEVFYSWLLEVLGKTLGRQVTSSADLFIAITKDVKSFLLKIGLPENKVKVVPTGVDTDRFRPLETSYRKRIGLNAKKVVLFVGRMCEEKGVIQLLHALKDVFKDNPDAKCLMVGDGPLRNRALSLASTLGISQKIIHLPKVNHDEMPLVYNAADIFVLPSRYEPFGMSATEAMASGIPAIASRVGGLAETVLHGKTGLLVKVQNTMELANAISDLLQDDEKRREMGKAARKHMLDHYSWPHVAKKTVELYKSIA